MQLRACDSSRAIRSFVYFPRNPDFASVCMRLGEELRSQCGWWIFLVENSIQGFKEQTPFSLAPQKDRGEDVHFRRRSHCDVKQAPSVLIASAKMKKLFASAFQISSPTPDHIVQICNERPQALAISVDSRMIICCRPVN